jgi:hypothetical protein
VLKDPQTDFTFTFTFNSDISLNNHLENVTKSKPDLVDIIERIENKLDGSWCLKLYLKLMKTNK